MNSIEMMSYSFGAILGDGILNTYLVRKRYTYRVHLGCGDPEIPHLVCDDINGMFDDESKVTIRYLNNKPYYEIRYGRRDIYEFFDEYTNHKTQLPGQILYGDDNAKRLALAGLLDTDGYVHKDRFHVGFCNTNYELIETVAQIFRYFDMRVYGPSLSARKGAKSGNAIARKDCFRLSTRCEDFHKAGCMFLVQRKQEAMLRYMAINDNSSTYSQ
jgi:hypothetical protein